LSDAQALHDREDACKKAIDELEEKLAKSGEGPSVM